MPVRERDLPAAASERPTRPGLPGIRPVLNDRVSYGAPIFRRLSERFVFLLPVPENANDALGQFACIKKNRFLLFFDK
jgi:hypothetical protein